jgi:Zn-dependent M28 family amino/carboxypeptidase
VWVSYGLQSKANDVDMLKGVNPSGKIVIMRDGPLPGISDADWEKSKMGFNIRLNIMQSGAAAVVVVTNSDAKRPAEELISYFKRRQISMTGEKGYPPQVPPIVYLSAAGAEKLFKEAGLNFDEEMAVGNTKAFKAKDLKIKAKISAKYTDKKVTANNVVGVLEGSDPTLKSEAVLFSAHYDAFGKINGEIYNGAADNALGTAEMLSVAEAYSKLSQKPKRSMVFLAVTGEEYGLYGSKAWAKDPTWDIKKVAADLNLDGIGSEVYGPVKTIVGFGAEHSTIGNMLNDLAGSLDIDVIPDPMPEEKVFYRSDHYSFVERGVPSLMLLGAPGGEKEIWMQRIKDWEKGDYHQPGDDILDTWAWEGAETVAEVMGVLGWRISDAATMPSWLPNSRFGDLKRGNTKELPSEDEGKD